MKKKFLPLFFLIFAGFINGLAFEEKARDSEKKKKEAESLFHPHEEIVVTATMTRKAVKDCS